MRLPTVAASILAIGLVAAACGGDDATPAPTDEPTPAAAATDAVEEPVEEPTEAPAEAEPTEAPVADDPTEEPAEEEATAEAVDEEATAEPEFAKKAAITNEDDPATTFAMASGRYRMQWQTTDCEQVDILVTQTDGDFTYPHPSKSSFASATINDMPEGVYTIEQLDPACEEWSIRVDWMTN